MTSKVLLRVFAGLVAVISVHSVSRAEDTLAVLEDCLPFNPDSVSVAFVQGNWKIVDGSQWMFDFGDREQEARRALGIIRYYRIDTSCFAGRPHPPMIYLLSSGKAPVGPAPGEQCEAFDPTRILLEQVGEAWRILSGNGSIIRLRSTGKRRKSGNAGNAASRIQPPVYRWNYWLLVSVPAALNECVPRWAFCSKLFVGGSEVCALVALMDLHSLRNAAFCCKNGEAVHCRIKTDPCGTRSDPARNGGARPTRCRRRSLRVTRAPVLPKRQTGSASFSTTRCCKSIQDGLATSRHRTMFGSKNCRETTAGDVQRLRLTIPNSL